MLDHGQFCFEDGSVLIKSEARHDSYFSLSTTANDMEGITLLAKSSSSKHPIVAISAVNPATRAWTNWSLMAREKAGMSTFFCTELARVGARRPISIQVLVRIDASVSSCALAKCRSSSLFNTRSDSCRKG